ncbi:MAG: hypothetical protein KBD27_03130 [Candidatus Moranbacteria bacterium]|nr:hypothetical protein [Candidatus Moranbacteria bacterium]
MGTLFANLGDLFSVIGTVFSVVLSVWFILFPPLLYFVFKVIWMLHVNGHYGSKIKWVLLEIIPPRDIEKSPALMESIFSGFAGVMKSPTALEEFIKGEFPTSFSLEIASIEGQVHFYVRTQAGFQNLVEAHFYAQYPGVEVVEVEDYTNLVPKTIPNKDWDLWGTDFVFVKPDLYPIKTYRFFEETVTGKMIDPLGGLIETMGKTGPGQYIWLQYIITPYSEKWYSTGQGTIDEFLGKEKKKSKSFIGMVFGDIWEVFANITKGLMGQPVVFGAGEKSEKKEEQPLEFRLSPGQKKVLEALENNLGKQMFKTRMRHVYIGKRSVFSKQTGVSSFIGAIKQFNDFNLNSFKPNDDSKTYANYIFTEERLRFRQRRLLRRYRTRDSDPQSSRFMLSTEELATIFHIPDMAVTAPTLTRVAARRGGAPMNLPLQEFE